MKIISYLFIVLLLGNLLFGITTSLTSIRKISVTDRHAYEGSENYNKVVIPADGKINVKTHTISQFIFLNNSNLSLLTSILGLIIFVMVILLLFGSDSIRFKIYQSNSIQCFIALLICSAIISWYFTKSFVTNPNNGLTDYKYRFNYGDAVWLLFLSFLSLQVVAKFKQKNDEYNLQLEN